MYVYLECLEGKDKDGGGGGGVLLCRRVTMVSSLPYAYGQVGSMIFSSFLSYTVGWVATSKQVH